MSLMKNLIIIAKALKEGKNTATCECGGTIEIITRDKKLSGAHCPACGYRMIV
jgi:predicted RNA-binding Zn-ribbon protein involved in translation (DUF1610 family)